MTVPMTSAARLASDCALAVSQAWGMSSRDPHDDL